MKSLSATKVPSTICHALELAALALALGFLGPACGGIPDSDDPQANQPSDEIGVARQAVASTVTVCFRNGITLGGVNEPNIDFWSNTSQSPRAYSTFILTTDPAGTAGSFYLDSNGCKTITRVQGNWTFKEYLLTFDWPVAGVTLTASEAPFTIPISPPKTVTIGAAGNPADIVFTFAAGADASAQVAFAIVQQTILRAMSLGLVVKQKAVLNIKLTGPGLYAAPASCPSGACYEYATSSLFLGLGAAVRRFGVAHETGHWIEGQWSPSDGGPGQPGIGLDFSYCKAGDAGCTVPPPDACKRDSGDGSHSVATIEWQSAAHREGFADFIAMLAFNNSGLNADCHLFDFAAGITPAQKAAIESCEAPGLTLKTGNNGGQCYEWFGTRPGGDLIFWFVANEYDMAKLYWDLFTDTQVSPSALKDYLISEASQTGWTRDNHIAKIVAGLHATSPALETAFRNAALQNIWDGGSAH